MIAGGATGVGALTAVTPNTARRQRERRLSQIRAEGRRQHGQS
jgi:hypothetical protein